MSGGASFDPGQRRAMPRIDGPCGPVEAERLVQATQPVIAAEPEEARGHARVAGPCIEIGRMLFSRRPARRGLVGGRPVRRTRRQPSDRQKPSRMRNQAPVQTHPAQSCAEMRVPPEGGQVTPVDFAANRVQHRLPVAAATDTRVSPGTV